MDGLGDGMSRSAPGDEMVNLDSVQRGRTTSKSSASSLAALKEEISRGAGQSAMEGVESDEDVENIKR